MKKDFLLRVYIISPQSNIKINSTVKEIVSLKIVKCKHFFRKNSIKTKSYLIRL